MNRALACTLAICLALTACGGDDKSDTTTTKKPGSTTTTAPDVAAAVAAFCGSANAYVDSLDSYTGLLSGEDATVTVGQVQDGVSSLAQQRETLESDLTNLEAAVKAVDTTEEGAQKPDDSSTETTAADAVTTTTLLSEQTAEDLIARVNQAEDDFDTAVSGIDASTPVSQAEVEFTSAAYALQVAWQDLLTEAGCVEDAGAVDQVQKFVAGLQTDLQTLGFYDGAIDGILGPETTAAIKAFQTENGLPVTGLPDPATQKAINAQLAQKAAVSTSALQGLLAGLGLYTGPINGQWSPELEAAMKQLQAILGVPQTGVMDTATLKAYAARKAGLQELLAAEERNATSTTTAAPTTAAPTTAAPTTAAPTTAPTTAAPTTTTTTTTTSTTTTTTSP